MASTDHADAAARHLDMAIRDLQRMPDAREVLLQTLKARQALIEMQMTQAGEDR